jgi:hypothetical protein
MDAPKKRDWFNVGAVAPFSVVLFTCAFGLFTRSIMSLQADILWTIGIIVIAFLVWLNAAKTQQRAREDRERAWEDRERLDKIIQLLAKPETTLEDVRIAAAVGETGRLNIVGNPAICHPIR